MDKMVVLAACFGAERNGGADGAKTILGRRDQKMRDGAAF